MKFDIIVAAQASDGGIGVNGTIPWHIKHDMRFFKETTQYTSNPEKVNAVIMGRKTWESLPQKPLKNRINIVLSQTVQNLPGAFVCTSLDNALAFMDLEKHYVENVFVIGGEEIYKEAMQHRDLNWVLLTAVFTDYECDKFFPMYDLLDNKEFAIVKDGVVLEENKTRFKYSSFIKTKNK